MREWTERGELTTYWRVSKWGNKKKRAEGRVESGKRKRSRREGIGEAG